MASIRDGLTRLPIRLKREAAARGFTLARVDAFPDEVKAINAGTDAAKQHVNCSRGSLMRGLALAVIGDKSRAERVARLAALNEVEFEDVVATILDAGLDVAGA